MLTAFCARTRHTGIRNVFIVWNSDSLFVSLLEPRQKILAGVERGCRGIGLEQEVAVVTYRWRRLSSRSEAVKIRILIEQKCWLFMMNSHKLLSGRFAKCRNMEISWRGDEQGSPIHCHMSSRSISPSTLFLHYHANTFRIRAWSMETDKNLFWMKISITANINPGKT